MSITTSARNKLMDAINTAVVAIAEKAIGKPAERFANQAPIAWEYFAASMVSRRADARKKAAERLAVKAGVIPDKERDPEPPGTNRIVYNDGVVNIQLVVASEVTKVDPDLLVAAMRQNKVKPEVIERCLELATSKTRPSHRFTAGLNLT